MNDAGLKAPAAYIYMIDAGPYTPAACMIDAGLNAPAAYIHD